MNLSRIERETIVTYNQQEEEAGVYTLDPSLIRRLMQLSEERPAECRVERRSHDGRAVDFCVPKSWIRIVPPRRVNLTEEQRQQAVERMAKARLARKPAF